MRKAVLQLLLQPGLGSVFIAKLQQAMPASEWARIAHTPSAELVSTYGIPPAKAVLIRKALQDERAYHAHEAWCQAHGVKTVLLGDPEYPLLLAQIATPPLMLWVKGELPHQNETACALVGSRDANHYGSRAVRLIVPALVASGIVTVSGGARGIDTWVHEETINAGGKTIAVMGCGFGHTYPAENADLFARIVASGGALISPFAPEVSPLPGLFPVRNRLIAGIAHACIVVQAASKSGALITAAHALEENREVGAVPGQIDDHLAAGTNDLLAQGARVIVDGATAVELCGKKTADFLVDAIVDTQDPAHQRILLLLDRPKSFDELLEEYGDEPSALHEQLFLLQVSGKVTQNHAGLWLRID